MSLDVSYLRYERRDQRFDRIRVRLELLCSDETINGEIDGGIDPCFVMRESRAAENGGRDTGDDFCQSWDNRDFGPFCEISVVRLGSKSIESSRLNGTSLVQIGPDAAR